MKTACTTQCKECPFRHNSIPSYLGDYTNVSVFQSIWHGIAFFCHSKINYRNPKWAEKAVKNGKLCLGAMVFAKKMMAGSSEDAEINAARAMNEDRNDVDCMEVREFMAWHDPEKRHENFEMMKENRKEIINSLFVAN